MRYLLIHMLFLIVGTITVRSQELAESIVAIVGNEVIYLSDLESIVSDMKSSGSRTSTNELRCNIFEELLISKLLVDQARIDSIIVTNDMVENELNMRMNDAIRRAGGEEALTGYFKKSILEIRKDIREKMVEQETARQVQSNITESVTVTPSALKKFYSSIPKDSLPVIPARYEVSIIQLEPPSNDENKADARQKLLDIRRQILEGKSFSVLARLYSEDTESAKQGGEIGFMTRGELEKPYSDAAFSLTKNTVSKIVETKFGYHIIQLIERKGEMVNTRHILIRPKVKPEQAVEAMTKLDSIATAIRNNDISFEAAALRYSTHKESRINGGKFVNTNSADRVPWLTLDVLNPEMYVKIRNMNVGEISDAFRTTDENNNVVFRIIKLDKELPAHTANLKDDYQSLYNAALVNEKSKAFNNWIKKKLETTYIKISPEFKYCEFLKEGWLK